jgi:dienelactone hydrolase
VRSFIAAAAVAAALALVPSGFAKSPSADFNATVDQILAQPYQPAYVPLGFDTAFPAPTANTAPAEDYTSGSIPGSPDYPAWPAGFRQVLFTSGDGAPLFGMLGLHPGSHPGVVVVHGFNTHGYASVIRWAAVLYARGYDVLAADQRDFFFENQAGYGTPNWLQTFGWEESTDVLAAGRYLGAQPGVGSIGVIGFSEGAQNTVLALALDQAAHTHVFTAGLTFSAPADQNTQMSTNRTATDTLVALVTPGETTACGALDHAAAYYRTTGFGILTHETAMHAQSSIRVPLLNFYAQDDSLVPAFEAQMMAAYNSGNPLQRTVELQRGEHAYFFDRWWQQRAALLYFKALLPSAAADPTVTTSATVNQTPGGAPASAQTVALGPASTAWADAQLAPYICDPAQGVPGMKN